MKSAFSYFQCYFFVVVAMVLEEVDKHSKMNFTIAVIFSLVYSLVGLISAFLSKED